MREPSPTGANALNNGSAPAGTRPQHGERPGSDPAAPDHSEEALAEQLDDAVPSYGFAMQPMIGLGASAGGIPALRAFFTSAAPDAGFAYVVVLHLAADRESRLAELLQTATSMPVQQVNESAKVEPNHVYVIPPGKSLASADGFLHLTDLPSEPGKRVAVDLFFRTLADTHGPQATAIVLSGADGDGAIGIKRIKERGGLTIAQEPQEAEHSGMPRSAIATGMVDWVLPVAAMHDRVVRYQRVGERIALPPEEGPQPAKPRPITDAGEVALRQVLTHLHNCTGHDFTYYKRATILRRIARRMKINEKEDLQDYLTTLRMTPGEATALLQDLLISVTNFFRDPEAFAALEAQLPTILAQRVGGEPIRAWVPACATGEEAYSIAILLAEAMQDLQLYQPFQIFATDLDEAAIRTARDGIYPATIAADVSEERLKRFFVKDLRGYRVKAELRESILFARHDLLRDSAFSRIDLLSCRNLMIYLDREAQERALDILHFSLKPGGRLFLGLSETAEHSNQFATVDKRHRIFMPRPASRTSLPIPLGQTTVARALALQRLERERPASTAARGPSWPLRDQGSVTKAPEGSWRELHLKLLERIAPPSLLVTPTYEIVHLSETAGRFLQINAGDPSLNLLRIIHPDLLAELRTVLLRAEGSDRAVASAPQAVVIGGERLRVVLRVSRTSEAEGNHLLVIFDSQPDGVDASEKVPGDATDAPVRDKALEQEIEDLKWHLRDLTERRDLAIEEMRSSNEELHAMNEELRSATEELETSREELQSINEELTTVNHEMKSKVDELAQSNADLQNLIAATSISAIFLSRELTISRFTPSAVQLFKLLPGDIGRPLDDLAPIVDYPQITADAQAVLSSLVAREREVPAGPRWFHVRVLPYRTQEDRIAGVVITFTDITGRRLAETAVRRSEQRMRAILDNAIEYAIVSMDLERHVTAWNVGAERIFGWSRDEAIGQSADITFTAEDRQARAPDREADQALSHGSAADEREHVRRDGSQFWGSGVMMPLRDELGRAIGLLKILRDQTLARATQEQLVASRESLEDAFAATVVARAQLEESNRAKDRFLAILSHELRTPLTPVVMAVRALERESLPERARTMVEVIHRNVRAELHLIDDLLDVTRISAGKLALVREPVDMHVLIQEGVEVCEAEIQARRHRLRLALDAPSHRIQGDANRLRQAIWNLVRNAAKFTPEGGRISISTGSANGWLHVVVADTGIGIEAERLDSIFDAFEQGPDRMVRDFGGLGLGLAIVKAIVEAHGGTLRAESEGPDFGATFTVTLPLDAE